MRFSRWPLAFIVLIASCFGCMSTKGFVKDQSRLTQIRRIAVLPFKSNQPVFGVTIAESISAELIASRFAIVERSQIDAILAEQRLTVEGVVEGRESFVGKIRGIDALVLGSVSVSRGFAGLAFGGNIDYISACTARLVDAATGEILYAVNFKSDAPNTFSGVATPGAVASKIASELAKQ
jgi:TolB-like protein